MTNTTITPELVTDAAMYLGRIRDSLDEFSAPIEVIPAGADEISIAISVAFEKLGLEFEELSAQARSFHLDFVSHLTTSTQAYQAAEATNVLIMTGTSTGGSLGIPSQSYLSAISQYLPAGSLLQGLTTPEQMWPLSGSLTLGESVSQGVTILNNAINNTSGPLGVFGYSQSAAIITVELRDLIATGSPRVDQLSFTLVGNINNPDGGLFERFNGLYIPGLDISFNGATPAGPYSTTTYTAQYDGVADFPRYPLNLISDLNAIMGASSIHPNYPNLDLSSAVQLPTNGGNSTYYEVLTQDLPLLTPLRGTGFWGNILADLIQPDLRVIVDMGYSSGDYANVPTPATIFEIPNLGTIVPDLAIGTVQGVQAAGFDLGLGTGVTMNTYPYIPVVDPNLNLGGN